MREENMSNKKLPLKNIEVFASALHYAKDSPIHLPRMVVFYGYSGYGKTVAAAYVTNAHDCLYVQIDATWTVSHLLDEILREIGVTTREKTIAKKMAVVVENLIIANKPLILDEFDHMVKPKTLEIVRALQDKTRVPLILIGEENLPKELEKTERFHNRVLKWVKAEPVSLEDAKHLAKLYVPNLEIADDLLAKLVKLSQGRIRRVCVNLKEISDEAITHNWKSVDAKIWGNKSLSTGSAPAPRRI